MARRQRQMCIRDRLKSEESFMDNELHGFFREYFSNGQLRMEGEYKNGKQIGEWKFYDTDGNLELEGNY